MVIKATVNLGHKGWPREMQQVDESGVIQRYQVAITPVRYAFLIRHYNHYCGYALVPPTMARLAFRQTLHRLVSYAGMGSRQISWYRVGENGQLNHRHRVDLYEGENEWVGFHLSDFESIDFEFAKGELHRFSETVMTFMEVFGDSPVAG